MSVNNEERQVLAIIKQIHETHGEILEEEDAARAEALKAEMTNDLVELQNAENDAKLAKDGHIEEGKEMPEALEAKNPEQPLAELELQSDIYSYTFYKFAKD